MSIQSLNNGQLQLSELVISNEKYTGATGYVASSSSFSSSVAGSNLSTPQIILTNATSETTISCLGVNTLSTPNVSTGNVAVNTALTLYGTPSTNNVSMACLVDNAVSIYASGQSGASVPISCLTTDILSVPNISTGSVGVNTSLSLYNPTNSADNVALSCIQDNIASIYANGTSGISCGFGCYSDGNMQIYNTTTGTQGVLVCSAIQFLANGSSGSLSCNSSGQLTYNGVVVNVP